MIAYPPSVFEESTRAGTADAPEGAMQFLVERNTDGSASTSDIVVWVWPKEQTAAEYAVNPCSRGCGEHHRLVVDLLSEHLQEKIREAARRADNKLQCVVCICRGRLIE